MEICYLLRQGQVSLRLDFQTVLELQKEQPENTLTAPYADLVEVEKLLKENKDNVAAIIVEPIVGNGFIKPEKAFHDGLRNLCDQYGALLIFDEVMTGFRVSLGGAQEYFGITPDLSCFGKVIGGGMPFSCIWWQKRNYVDGRTEWTSLPSRYSFRESCCGSMWPKNIGSAFERRCIQTDL